MGESRRESHGRRVAAGELWWESCGRRVLFIIGMGSVRGVEGRVIGVVEKKNSGFEICTPISTSTPIVLPIEPKIGKVSILGGVRLLGWLR